MGIRTPRAILSTLLIAGVFFAPLMPSVLANEIASTTPDVLAETVEVPVLIPVLNEIPRETASITNVIPESQPVLPTGVLYDSSFSDEAWSLDISAGGYYANFFGGYSAPGNPPIVAPENAWISTGTTTYARVKLMGSTTCSRLAYGSTAGLGIYRIGALNAYDTDGNYNPHEAEGFCDFRLSGQGIPPGTPLSMIYLGAAGTTTIAGSKANRGISTNGYDTSSVPGGFAFQLCGSDGCSGGFQPSTTTTTTTTTLGPHVSNVLFLPGIKGSRLYSDEIKCSVFGCDNKLWDPGSNDDIQDLFLTLGGTSIRSDIYVKKGDIIDKIDKKYYLSFIEQMNALQASSTFSGGEFRWTPAAYDWRLSLNDILTNGVERDGKVYYQEASSTPYIEQTLRQLASSSKTGKVTIIAHSNGGLVTKALLSKLGSVETARLVDKIIFVGVPQTGAPQAIGGLLFGNREGLPSDSLPFIASLAHARALALNSPMAYHLLPSGKYFANVQDPNHSVIGFSGTRLYEAERSAYGPSVDTSSELYAFLRADERGRIQPEFSDTQSANILSSSLISYADTTHGTLDSWTPPVGVDLYQIAGWGNNTVSGIDLYDEQKLLGLTTGYKRQYRPVFVEDGDGVVPVPSALATNSADNVKRYWIDLERYSVNNGAFSHGDFFEAPVLQDIVRSILNDTQVLPSFVSVNAPNPTNKDRLIFQLHSPLTLGIYDEAGNYTGINTDGTVRQNVAGAEYGEFGEVKYIIAPAGATYKLVMNGQSSGEFSLDIQEQVGGKIATTTTFANIPTTSNTTASLTITSGISGASSLKVDTNGDGTTDIEVAPQAGQIVVYSAPVVSETILSTRNSRSRSITQGSVLGVSLERAEFQAPPQLHEKNNTVIPLRKIPERKDIVKGNEAVLTPAINLESVQSKSDVFTKLNKWLSGLLYNIWKQVASYLISFIP